MKDFLYLKRGRRGSFIRYEMMINVIVKSRKSKSGLKKGLFQFSLSSLMCSESPKRQSFGLFIGRLVGLSGYTLHAPIGALGN